MRILSLTILCAAAMLAGCSSDPSKAPSDPENCQATGDEDGNGLADCADPACAGTAACRSGCGNGRLESTEVCDDGNATNGDGCDSNCTISACGNGIVAGTEVCDDGNATSGDGCDSNCTPTACGNGIVTGTEVCDDGNATNGDGCDSNCTPTACGNGIVTGTEVCDDGNSTNWDGCDNTCTRSLLSYIKASNTDEGDAIGFRVALSADGTTLAVASELESSKATGIDGDDGDNTADASGAVYVYVRSGTTWRQQAYVKASNTGAGDHFGASVALSADGSTLAVGAFGEASAATDIGGAQGDNSAPNAGAVYVFTRTGDAWTQQAYVKASNTGAGDQFGKNVSLSGDGSSLAVGAIGEADGAGASYVFTRSETTWSPQAFIKASNAGEGDGFGGSVTLSADGSTLAVGAAGEDSAGDNPGDDSAPSAGAVYVFTRDGAAWNQQAYVKPSSAAAADLFGISVALSADGSTLAAGAEGAGTFAGAVHVFTRSGAAWSQQASVRASNTAERDQFGISLALSADGASLAVGAPNESSAATGVDGNQADNSARLAGAVYLFRKTGASWTQQSYVKATNTGEGDLFGSAVALSGDGVTLAIGAPFEDSGATGIDGEQGDDSVVQSGAVYVFN